MADRSPKECGICDQSWIYAGKAGSFDVYLPEAIEKLSDPMYVSLYQAFLKTQENYTFYTAPKLDSYLDLETKFEELIRQTLSVKAVGVAGTSGRYG